MNSFEKEKIRQLLLLLLEANNMEGVKQWSLQITFQYCLARFPELNSTDLWILIKDLYTQNLKISFPDQEDTGQSYRRTSGDAFESYLIEYINNIPAIEKLGISAIKLKGKSFENFISSLNLSVEEIREKDVDIFLQGIKPSGKVEIFGAIFPKASYAERIRADEGASRKLISKNLLSITITLDARNELGTEEHPSVKRQTINSGGFDACFSLNAETSSGGRIKVIDPRKKQTSNNPLIKLIIDTWNKHLG